MFDWLKQKRKSKHTEDPVFGHLTFVVTKDPALSYWEGSGRFSPVDANICYCISAEEAGPGETQRAVYRRIAERYGELSEAVTPLLRHEFDVQMGDSNTSSKVIFGLDGLFIPEAESRSMKWEMHFSCSDGDDWVFTVHMLGWRPTGQISVSH